MQVTEDNFEKEVIEKSEKVPVITDFWAEWCGPCKMLAPIIEKIVDSYNGKIILAKINVDECPGLSDRFGINAIPAVKLFKNGKIVGEFKGLVPDSTIKKLIDKNL